MPARRWYFGNYDGMPSDGDRTLGSQATATGLIGWKLIVAVGELPSGSAMTIGVGSTLSVLPRGSALGLNVKIAFPVMFDPVHHLTPSCGFAFINSVLRQAGRQLSIGQQSEVVGNIHCILHCTVTCRGPDMIIIVVMPYTAVIFQDAEKCCISIWLTSFLVSGADAIGEVDGLNTVLLGMHKAPVVVSESGKSARMN